MANAGTTRQRTGLARVLADVSHYVARKNILRGASRKRLERIGSVIDFDTHRSICRKVYRGPFAEERAFDERTALEVCRRVDLLAPRALCSGHGKAPWLEMTLMGGSAWEGHIVEDPREYVTAVGTYIRRLHEMFRPDCPGFGWLPSKQDIFAGSADFLLFLMREEIA